MSVLPILVSGLGVNSIGFDSAAHYLLRITYSNGSYGRMGKKLDWAKEGVEPDIG
jgi:hypothetical protein